MSTKKDNFNQAVYDMFGVGKNQENSAEERRETVAEQVTEQPREEQTWTQPGEMVPQTQPVDMTAPMAQMNMPVAGPTVAPFSVVAATYIAPGTVIEGNIRCKGDVEIAGEFKGILESEGDVTVRTSLKGDIKAANLRVIDCRVKGDSKVTGRMIVDASSVIEGNIEAAELHCSGVLRGDSRIANNITLDASAKIFGNIETDTMSMDRGATISGSLTMGKHWDEIDEAEAKEAEAKEAAKEAEEVETEA